MKPVKISQHSSSFRDPSGFIFSQAGVLFRQVNQSYKDDYDHLMNSGLYEKLIDKGMLISHQDADFAVEGAYKILKPKLVPFISYPYEWSFSQLKDAALLTLKIQRIALKYGMTLKDASAYNIQFDKNRPILIDTLSFKRYEEGAPWVAYRQFCQHFLAPLALQSYVDLRLGALSEIHLDGVPLDLASKLLPARTRLSLGLATHLHLHARSQRQHADTTSEKPKSYHLPKTRLLAIINNLQSTITSLSLPKQRTTWQDYYSNTNYSDSGLLEKQAIVKKWIDEIKPKSVWDAGANDGYFSQLASNQGILTIATDFDQLAVDHSYLQARKRKDEYILPLIIDLTNPSPAIGWSNQERQSFLTRGHFDLTLALALIHHLAFSNNVPLLYIAQFFSNQTQHLVIEFVPKEDSNAQRLLINRENIFEDYNQPEFEKAFGHYFNILDKARVNDSLRTMYLMEKK